jgi:hypothetical protein
MVTAQGLKFAFPGRRKSGEWRAELKDRPSRPVYSIAFHPDRVNFCVHEAGLHRQLFERLRYEGLNPRCDWYWLVFPEAQLRFALKRPRWLLSFQGLKAIWSVGKVQRFRGDIEIARPMGTFSDGQPDAFGQQVIGRLRTLEGRRFSLSEIGRIFFQLRRETMTDDQMRSYIEGMR